MFVPVSGSGREENIFSVNKDKVVVMILYGSLWGSINMEKILRLFLYQCLYCSRHFLLFCSVKNSHEDFFIIHIDCGPKINPFDHRLCSSDDWQVKSVQSATQCTAQFLNLCWLLLLCLEPAGFLAENNKVWLSLLLYLQLGAQLSWNWVCSAVL